MDGIELTFQQRIARLRAVVGEVTVSCRPMQHQPMDVLVAVTSSRLGHDPSRHRCVCQFLCQSLLDCRHRGATLLVATGSAIEPWAVRAAEIFAVPLLKLSVQPNDPSADILVGSPDAAPLSRDAVVIAMADRVDAVHVRRGGTIQRCLQRRIDDLRDASTRVAVSSMPGCAARELIDAGAIGWFRPAGTRAADAAESAGRSAPQESTGISIDVSGQLKPQSTSDRDDDSWTRTEGQWLIHCTRAPSGAWPGETERQYRDSILLGKDSSSRRGPLEALLRIVRSSQIAAAATATMKKHPVVCFSALSLHELLQRRCFRPQLCRWDYEPYGVAIRLSVARRLGIQPVVYGPPKDRSTLPPEQQFRFHPVGKTFDWREEREWRSSKTVDLAALDRGDIRVFAEDRKQCRTRLRRCPWRVTFVSVNSEQQQASLSETEKRV